MAGNRQDYSEETARAIDAEVRHIVLEGYAVAHKLLSEHLAQLKSIAEALLEVETIDGEDLDRLMKGDKIERRPPRPPAVKQELKPEAQAAKEKRPSLFAPPTLPTPEPEKA
jgi:cell division protease FtsH